MRPPICLRYAMWALAAVITDKYRALHPHFYHRARKYAELDQMKGIGEVMISVAHAQCWVLIGGYEFKMMMFPRAWMSTGHSMRLGLMMGLHRQDGVGLDVKQCLPQARDWTEREERRRTFWAAFCQDRYASIGTGWPMMIDERDVCFFPFSFFCIPCIVILMLISTLFLIDTYKPPRFRGGLYKLQDAANFFARRSSIWPGNFIPFPLCWQRLVGFPVWPQSPSPPSSVCQRQGP